MCEGTGVPLSSYGPTTEGIGFNSAWISQVLPRITWLKQACPTCYAFQFDDPSSTFGGFVSESETNPANATNYTVTFCPNGISINN